MHSLWELFFGGFILYLEKLHSPGARTLIAKIVGAAASSAAFLTVMFIGGWLPHGRDEIAAVFAVVFVPFFVIVAAVAGRFARDQARGANPPARPDS